MSPRCIVHGCHESLADCLCSPCPRHDGYCELCPHKAVQKYPPIQPRPSERKVEAHILEPSFEGPIGVFGAFLMAVAFVLLFVTSLFIGGRRG